MRRREFLRFLGLTPIILELDPERLLWTPGAKKIFLPTPGLSESQILAMEIERLFPKLHELFNRDDMFFKNIKSRKVTVISNTEMRVPFIIKPGGL